MTEQPNNRYIAVPRSGKGAGVLVLHAWWGLNDFFKGFCDRLASQRFLAFAPDLHDGSVAKSVEEAKELRSKADEGSMKGIVLGATEYLQSAPSVSGRRLAVVGSS